VRALEHVGFPDAAPFILSLRSASSVSCKCRPATDEIGHGGNDAIGLLNDHEMPSARDIDDLHPLAKLILECMSVAGRGDYVVETLDH
jgi:hypothetical protein